MIKMESRDTRKKKPLKIDIDISKLEDVDSSSGESEIPDSEEIEIEELKVSPKLTTSMEDADGAEDRYEEGSKKPTNHRHPKESGSSKDIPPPLTIIKRNTNLGEPLQNVSINPITGKYKCLLCPKEFTASGFRHHFQTIHLQRRYKCGTCGLEFRQRPTYEQHYETTHNNVRFQCSECNRAFRTKPGMALHYRAAHLGERFPCKFCSKTFKYKNHLQIHVRRRECRQNEMDSEQPSGSKVDASNNGKDESLRQSNQEGDRKPPTKVTRPALRKRCVLNSKTGRHKCKDCSQEFTTLESFHIHYKSRHLKISYPCSVCGKAFTQRKNLNQHQRNIHPKIFKDLKHAGKHSKSKPGEEIPPPLTVKGKKKIGEPQLNFVMNPKTGHYKCRLCPKEYTAYAGFRAHFLSVHVKERYKCRFCEREFRVKNVYKQHYDRTHKGVCFQNNKDASQPSKVDEDSSEVDDDVKSTAGSFPSETGSDSEKEIELDEIEDADGATDRHEFDEDLHPSRTSTVQEGSKKPTEDRHPKPTESGISNDIPPPLIIITGNSNIGEPKENVVMNPNTGKYKCLLCPNKEYKSITGGFQLHFQAIHLQQRYKCGSCGLEFRQKSNYEQHFETTHNNVRFQCSECDRAFNTKFGCAKHYRAEHSGGRFPCEFCCQTFEYQHLMARHVKKWHNCHVIKMDSVQPSSSKVDTISGGGEDVTPSRAKSFPSKTGSDSEEEIEIRDFKVELLEPTLTNPFEDIEEHERGDDDE